MNTGLTDENFEALSRYCQERAHETLAEIPRNSPNFKIVARTEVDGSRRRAWAFTRLSNKVFADTSRT